ncbi:hypothetical protein IC614_05965 [Allosphingosinicella flava]|uniref:DUF429 domain-containing protein n=1 Tax=Allosphingosinicella flava TaxID=2771430 RepID=A0A7T2LN15_9SPHN|nr:hypothetical protein [Sphingosinicella flava]QPQ56111.1 hypothetical protein IC614_05965 [Sphingosinicella flava]
MHFTRFAAIDWSGAKGSRHKGIAVAICEAGKSAPYLIHRTKPWSRTEVLDWLLATSIEAPTLYGFDFSYAPPIAERGAYLPGEAGVPADAKAFWAYVDRLCDDPDLGAASFLETHHRPHFYFGAADGVKRDFLHHRVCEHAFNALGGGKASTLYDAIGASQVAKASYAGMRLLNRLQGKLPVWPFDPVPAAGSLVVEIYTRVFILMAGLNGRKVRDIAGLNAALAALGSAPFAAAHPVNDHETDVLIAAAGLRKIADDPAYWHPFPLIPEIARTEGWTFGVR